MILKTNSFIGSNVIHVMLSSWSREYWICCSERCEYPYLSCTSLDSIAAHDGVGCDLSLLAEITYNQGWDSVKCNAGQVLCGLQMNNFKCLNLANWSQIIIISGLVNSSWRVSEAIWLSKHTCLLEGELASSPLCSEWIDFGFHGP